MKRFISSSCISTVIISTSLVLSICYLTSGTQPKPKPTVESNAALMELCWGLRVSVEDKPVSASTVWTLGVLARGSDQHAEIVGGYSSMRELSPEARHGLCTRLSKLKGSEPETPAHTVNSKTQD